MYILVLEHMMCEGRREKMERRGEREGSNFWLQLLHDRGQPWRYEVKEWETTDTSHCRHKEQVLHLKSGQTWGLVPQRTCGISIIADIQNATGQGPEQPDVTSELAPCRTRRPPLGLSYRHYSVVPWFRFFFLNRFLNFSKYLHLFLVQHTRCQVCGNVHLAVLVHGSCMQGHLMERGHNVWL